MKTMIKKYINFSFFRKNLLVLIILSFLPITFFSCRTTKDLRHREDSLHSSRSRTGSHRSPKSCKYYNRRNLPDRCKDRYRDDDDDKYHDRNKNRNRDEDDEDEDNEEITEKFDIERSDIEFLIVSGCDKEYEDTIGEDINDFAHLVQDIYNVKFAAISCKARLWISEERNKILSHNKKLKSNEVLRAIVEITDEDQYLDDFFSEDSIKFFVVTVDDKAPLSYNRFTDYIEDEFEDDLVYVYGLYHRDITTRLSVDDDYYQLTKDFDGDLFSLDKESDPWNSELVSEISNAGLNHSYKVKHRIKRIIQIKVRGKKIPASAYDFSGSTVKIDQDHLKEGNLEITYEAK